MAQSCVSKDHIPASSKKELLRAGSTWQNAMLESAHGYGKSHRAKCNNSPPSTYKGRVIHEVSAHEDQLPRQAEQAREILDALRLRARCDVLRVRSAG